MAKEHGLVGLFGNNGDDDKAKGSDLPPVLDDSNASPLERLAKKLGDADPYAEPAEKEQIHHSPFGLSVPEEPPVAKEPAPVVEPEPTPEPAPAPEPTPEPVQVMEPVAEPPAPIAPDPEPRPEPSYVPPAPVARSNFKRTRSPLKSKLANPDQGILCFVLEGGDDRLRRRTLEALTVAAGHHGAIKLHALPNDIAGMNAAIEDAMANTDCVYAAFFNPGTEPADDWAFEVQLAFEKNPSAAAVSVRASNSDPLSPWARVSFFIDEVERQKGVARGFDTVVFRIDALQELGDKLAFAIRNGEAVHALQGQGQRTGTAVEARVKLATPTGRKEVMQRVREQARMAARIRAKRMNPIFRIFAAIFIVIGFPFRILAVRKAAKKAVGSAQFREVASKATMAVFADRRVRALTMLSPGKGE